MSILVWISESYFFELQYLLCFNIIYLYCILRSAYDWFIHAFDGRMSGKLSGFYGTTLLLTTTQINSALNPSRVAKLSTSFGWGKDGKVTAAGWQATLCDPIIRVISNSGGVMSIMNCYIRLT